MDFTDIIITKAGGLTISEALSKRLGIITVCSIPGQEERNANYLMGRKAILKADNAKEVRFLVERLLTNKSELAKLKNIAEKNSMKDSSLKIASFISNYLINRDSL